MDPSASSSSGLNGPNGRQKRVLPSRPRRGGPGIGTCDVDLMILEHHKRGAETEATIPNDMPFYLTTNSSLFSGPGTAPELLVTTVPSERYFDRPDVLKAYREQRVIQTPSYTNVQDNPSVGRFRPRGSEDAQIDTSDAAYERRHRKYENFERRQRLREKEKLKHEQYKLKERIEQLRIMDPSAFLALPASSFSPAPAVPEDASEDDLINFHGAHINGAAYSEGERRRREMLNIALSLEERYRVLLPPRKIQGQSSSMHENVTPVPPPARGSLPPSRRVDTPETERENLDDTYLRRQDRLKIKLKLGGNGSASQSPAPPGASRTFRRPTRMSIPPQPVQKLWTKRSRTELSRSPTPPMSPRRFETTYTSSEPVSPAVQVGIVPDDQGFEEIPPLTDGRRSSMGSENKFDINLAAQTVHTQAPIRIQSPEAPTPPQKWTPLPNTHPAPAPETNPLPFPQETSFAGSGVPPRPPPPEERPKASPIRVEFPLASRPAPSPPPIETLPNAPLSPPPVEVECAPTESPSRRARRTEEGSRLLELANAVQSITAPSPPTKRQKTWHHYSPPKYAAPSRSPLVSPTRAGRADHRAGQASASEQEPSLAAPPAEPIPPPMFPKMSLPPDDEYKVLSHPLRRSPSVSMAASESFHLSAASAPTSIPPAAAAHTPTPEITYSAFALSGPRRRGPQGRRQEVEYKSADTGELRRTQSLLLIAGIRGSQRQTQRHQMAFGVKVPEEISDPYDFWLPDEYLPEEELMKYRNYEGVGVGDDAFLLNGGSDGGSSALPMGQ